MPSKHDMNHADAAWLRMDSPENLMVIAAAMWFEQPVDEAELRLVVFERLVDRYPRFRQKAVEGLTGPHWEDDEDFDLDLHIHHLALPAPGDRRVLERIVGDLVSRPLDRARPLWEIHLLDGYGDGCAIVVRMHHAIADGIALARVMLGLTDDPEESADALFTEAQPGGLPQQLQRAVHVGAEALMHPREMASARLADARALASILTGLPERRHPLHDRIGIAHRVGWTRPLPLDVIKEAGAREGATINDVLVSCVAGALREHLLQRGDDARDIHAMVPFNLRPLDRPLPRDLGNRFGLVLLELPLSVEDPIDRLLETSRRMRAIKHSRQGAMSYAILGAIGRMPLALEKPIVELFASEATMTLTNVPGPRSPVFLAGVRLGGVLVWAPASGSMGMTVSIFSYDGDVTVGFMVNARLMDDADLLSAACEREFDVLLAAVN